MNADFNVWVTAAQLQDASDAYFSRLKARYEERYAKGLGRKEYLAGVGIFVALCCSIDWWAGQLLFTWFGVALCAFIAAVETLVFVARVRGARKTRQQLDVLGLALKGMSRAFPVHVDDAGLTFGEAPVATVVAWSEFREVVERPDLWLLCKVKGGFLAIPTADAGPDVLNYIRGRIALYGRP